MTKIYTVKRDNVCAGKVITDFKITEKNNRFVISSFDSCRSMLYVPTFDSKAEDLLYCSPNYPVFNGDNIKECNSSNFIIYNNKNIGKLLKFLGYQQELDYIDLENIRRSLFNGKFPLENLEKFGLIESDPEYQKYYDEKGNLVTNPFVLKKLIKERKRLQARGILQEYVISEDYEGLSHEVIDQIVLPYEYFELLRNLGDKSLSDVIKGYEAKTNAFKPAKAEGPIRSLKKYD